MKHLLLLFLLLTCIANAQDSNTVSVISAERQNIVYRGVPNSLKIGVPGSKSFTASAPGLTKDSLGNYKLSPGPGNEIKIMIDAVMHDNSVIHEEKVFRIKGLPAPSATINGEGSKYPLVMSTEQLINAEIGIEMKNFLLLNETSDFFKVHSFTVTIGKKTFNIEGNIIKGKITAEIKKIKSGTFIIIEDVRYGVQDPTICRGAINPIVVEIR